VEVEIQGGTGFQPYDIILHIENEGDENAVRQFANHTVYDYSSYTGGKIRSALEARKQGD
jgi:hypothetical protein